MKAAMFSSAAFLLGLLTSCSAVEVRSLDEQAPEGGKRFPVSKVVTLLRDMQAELQKEAEQDEEVFDKMNCWCQTNRREKSANLQDAEQRITELTTIIETTAADSARLKQEIQNHDEDLARSQESLNTATALREKQAGEFNGEEKDMIQSIQALDSAIVVLSKHHGGQAFLDGGVTSGPSKLQTIALEAARNQMERHQNLLLGKITPHQRRLLLALGQDAGDLADEQPAATHLQAYQPQSSEIFGILKQMKETFETNLAESQKEEAQNAKSYEELKSAKEAEIHAVQSAIDQKRTQLAETDERHAQSQEDIEDTRNSLTLDDTFLQDLIARCDAANTEYEARVKMRQEEMTAVAEAIQILSDDDAHDTFSKTFNAAAASFIQKGVSSRSVKRHQQSSVKEDAAALLRKAAMKSANPKLSALAAAARLQPMEKVKKAIDDLVQELLVEKQDEIVKRDSCIERANTNERDIERYTRDHTDLESTKQGLETSIAELHTQVETLTAEINELNVQIRRRGEDRELENHDFQQTVSDQRETQRLLQRALQVLQRVYSTREVPAAPQLLQKAAQPSDSRPPPPEGFGAYGQNRASGGVMGLLQQIIRDAQEMEKQAIADENAAQTEYESFVRDTNASVQSKQQQIVDKNGDRAHSEQTLIAAEQSIRAKVQELETLANTKSAINLDCEFTVKNFTVRQEARDQEIEALRQAKAILSGMESSPAA